MLKLSIVIPVHNEEGSITPTVEDIVSKMTESKIDHEILIVNDHSIDTTESVLKGLSEKYDTVRYINNDRNQGFGFAICNGLDNFKGDAVVIVMGDGSDTSLDIKTYYDKILEGYDCVFGSRFIKGSKVVDYPFHKLLLNRLANYFIKMLFGIKTNDTTNAFKCYKREVVEGMRPFLSHHFNLTVELPLKAIVRGYKYTVVPISWYGRKKGISKLKIKEMGSRYLFIVLYLFLEKYLSRGDYKKK
jgi:dolichol-phosphate mannosyltransferase